MLGTNRQTALGESSFCLNPIHKSKCVLVCLSVKSYARPHFSADPDETLQGDPGALLTGRVWNHPHGAPGVWGSQFQKGSSGSWNRGIILFSMDSEEEDSVCMDRKRLYIA